MGPMGIRPQPSVQRKPLRPGRLSTQTSTRLSPKLNPEVTQPRPPDRIDTEKKAPGQAQGMAKFSINLAEDILANVDARASESGVTRAEVIREAVTRYITQAAGPGTSEDATQQNPEVTHLGERVRELEQALLDEREQRIQDLKTAEDRRAQETARFQVLLQGAQKALPAPRAGLLPSLRALIFGRPSEPIDIGEG